MQDICFNIPIHDAKVYHIGNSQIYFVSFFKLYTCGWGCRRVMRLVSSYDERYDTIDMLNVNGN